MKYTILIGNYVIFIKCNNLEKTIQKSNKQNIKIASMIPVKTEIQNEDTALDNLWSINLQHPLPGP